MANPNTATTEEIRHMMAGNELQYGLIGLGLIAILGLVGYNLWQERRARKQAEDAFRATHHDVLLDGDVPETVPPAPGGRMEPELRKEPVAYVPPSAPGRTQVLRAQEPSLEWEDQAIDCAVSIEAPAGVSVAALFGAQQDVLAGASRALGWFGWDDAANQWFRIDARTPGSVNRAFVTLQLVDRRGAVTEGELARFYEQLQRVCDQFLAVPRLPSRPEVLARAAEIDQFCADVDIQIAVNVVAKDGGPFAGTKIRGLAEAAGLVLATDGCYHARDEAGRPLYTLANQEATLFSAEQLRHLHTSGLTLVLDVPRAPSPTHAFDRMTAFARQLAEALGGVMVDDNRVLLTDRSLGLIRNQIGQFEQQMERHGILAGSDIAQRLFS